MEEKRSIIHLNVAGFAASVEGCLAPNFKNSPLVIAPTGSPRAVVYDMNEQAFQLGIRKGMALTKVKQAGKRIPILPPRLNRYEQVMKAICKQALAYTPTIESGNWDGHVFLDVTGSSRLHGPPRDLAFRLRKEIRKSLGLNPVWSLATSKMVAKVASRIAKPFGEYIVHPGDEEDFLAPLDVALLPGISLDELKKIQAYNLVKISQVRALTLDQLKIPFPCRARHIHNLSRGIDPSPVSGSARARKEIILDHEFTEDTNDQKSLGGALSILASSLGRILRKANRGAGEIRISLSYSDGICHKAGARIRPATANEFTLYRHSARLMDRAWRRRTRIRHISLGCPRPARTQAEPSLFPAFESFAQPGRTGKEEQVIMAMDRIRDKFGSSSIFQGKVLDSQGKKKPPAYPSQGQANPCCP